MYSTTDKAGKIVWFCLQPDAEYDTYGYYVELYSDENGDEWIDSFDTYNHNWEQSFEIAKNRIAEECIYE